MSYGFKSTNSDGITQIDGVNDNIAIFATGTAIAETHTGNNITNIPYPANLPTDYLIFAKPSDPTAATNIPFSLVPRSTYFQFMLPLTYTDSISIDWAIGVKHSDMPATSTPDWGIKVFNSTGDVAFSSNSQNFRCQQVVFETISNLRFGSNTVFTVNDLASTYTLMSGHSGVGYDYDGFVRILHALCAVYDITEGFNATDGVIKYWTEEQQPIGITMVGGQSGSFGSGDITHLIGSIV